ncbi:MAG: hypothetical protein Q4C71_00645 [Microbacteriaceae bacterium]|nr:hypothetical protein [Microbacteriaceae bacterium]
MKIKLINSIAIGALIVGALGGCAQSTTHSAPQDANASGQQTAIETKSDPAKEKFDLLYDKNLSYVDLRLKRGNVIRNIEAPIIDSWGKGPTTYDVHLPLRKGQRLAYTILCPEEPTRFKLYYVPNYAVKDGTESGKPTGEFYTEGGCAKGDIYSYVAADIPEDILTWKFVVDVPKDVEFRTIVSMNTDNTLRK